MIRAVRGLGVLLVALAVVAGPPALVALWFVDHPQQLPSLADLTTDGPPGTRFVLAVGAIPALLVWLLVSTAVLRRGIRRARMHLRMPTPSQLTAGSMAGAVVLGGPAIVAVTAPATPAAAATTVGDTTVARGVELPDGAGWVPIAVGQAVASTAAALWLRRRRDYRPGASGSEELRPLPATVNALAALSGESTAAAALVDRLPAGGIALTGPGARDALRGLLISLLLSGRKVSITWADLGELLDDPYRAGPVPAGLRVVDDPDTTDSDEVTLTLHPLTSTGTWVSAGRGAAATRWEVDLDGTVTGTRRLCVLNARAATDLLDLLAAAHPQQPPTAGAPQQAVAALRLLGGCALSVGGRPVPVRRTAGLQVLAYLGLHPDGATGHELIAAIWPGLRPASITNRLYITISELRKDLRHGTEVELIRHERSRYRLTAAVEVDLHVVRDAAGRVDRAVTAAERRQAQRALIDAYAGELAAGCDWPWLVPARETLRRRILTGYVDLAEAAAPAEALQLLRAAITVDPCNDDIRARAAQLADEPDTALRRKPRPHQRPA
ncbi:hypothetical protein ACWT_3382 [Actinoplanes sp. SE50]|uniref:AfsR/SARP family transcriptional regulator n=1 Tax=unclassified Actinoplanes TaxID=2626549 RepID=UPI00023ED22F|nr:MULTISPECIES: hypothetical protein [unclassified Actinoplanes]AEV84405.1 hypothetical protein ACPL_3510 [Actinoplanes sp. SE50/110]ATO82797.1 hypothetical protein ACWT_3382 [Actinoplanes sp. SE50]SLM00205.1 hypothetical protein ACSP50_3437 [Actinoplanes sp. SE50/110]